MTTSPRHRSLHVLSPALLGLLCAAWTTPRCPAANLVAFSLRQAELLSQGSGASDPALGSLGGMTRVVGFVHDRARNDIILIGAALPEIPAASLEDFVVLLRSRLIHKEWPLVSIDPPEEGKDPRKQVVRYEGGIEGTAVGRDFVKADEVLKLYSLALLESLPGLSSYRDLYGREICRKVEASGTPCPKVDWLRAEDLQGLDTALDSVQAEVVSTALVRFWYYPIPARRKHSWRDPVLCIEDLVLGIDLQELVADVNPDPSDAALEFAREFSSRIDDLSRKFPVIQRLKLFYDLLVVAEQIALLSDRPPLDYFLSGFQVRAVETPKEYDLIELVGRVRRSDDRSQLVQLAGGIDLSAEIEFLDAGDYSGLLEIVLKARPAENSLSWPLPLDGWAMPNRHGVENLLESLSRTAVRSSRAGRAGSFVHAESVVLPRGEAARRVDQAFDAGLRGSIPPLGPAVHPGRLPVFSPTPGLPPLRGVSLRMAVSDESFRSPRTGKVWSLRQRALEARPAKDSLFWTLPRK